VQIPINGLIPENHEHRCLAEILFDWLWWTKGEGCPFVLVLKSGGPITFDSRLGVISLVQVWVWAFVGVSFGGPEVERWWKLNDL